MTLIGCSVSGQHLFPKQARLISNFSSTQSPSPTFIRCRMANSRQDVTHALALNSPMLGCDNLNFSARLCFQVGKLNTSNVIHLASCLRLLVDTPSSSQSRCRSINFRARFARTKSIRIQASMDNCWQQ
jgi:hypothetical protein